MCKLDGKPCNIAALVRRCTVILVTNANLNPFTEDQSLNSVLNVVIALVIRVSVDNYLVEEIVTVVKAKANMLLCWVNTCAVRTSRVRWLPVLVAV